MNRTYKINHHWKQLASRIVAPHHRVLVIGAPDTGKSTFCRYLIDFATAESLKTALVDADIGQSQIGPPTTIGMKLFEPAPTDGSEDKTSVAEEGAGALPQKTPAPGKPPSQHLNQEVDAFYFAGAITPQRNLLPVLTGTRLMADAAQKAGAEFTVIDTTGYVSEEAAVTLKQQKIELLRPNHVICLGRSGSMERIVACYSELNWLTLHYLLPHKQVRPKSSEARKRNRKARFEAYFAQSELQTVPFEQLRGARTPFFNGRIANDKELEMLTRHAEAEVLHAEWGHRTLSLVARKKPTKLALTNLKNFLSLAHITTELPVYFRHRLVGLIGSTGDTFALGVIENINFRERKLNIRCKVNAAEQIQVIQFGDHQFAGRL